MKLIFFAKPGGRSVEKLTTMMQSIVDNGNLEVCESIDNLVISLLRPGLGPDAVVLYATDHEDYLRLSGITDLLSELRIILIMGKGSCENMSLAHKLRPRFLAEFGNDCKEIRSVLEKMANNVNGSISKEGNIRETC